MELENVLIDRPSFLTAVWNDVAPKFDLDPGQGIYQLDEFTFPKTTLPPSFHEEVITASLKWLNAYQGRETEEAPIARLMGPWLVHVCDLFKGRIVDKPESLMPGTDKTSGGKVEHEIGMAEGILLFLIELKSCYKNLNDPFAQAILELHSVFSVNEKRDLDPTPAVCAIMTDLENFYFLRYDGSKFTRSKEIHVSSQTREVFLFGMIRVTERLFSILLQGYIDVLEAVKKRSKLRVPEGDVPCNQNLSRLNGMPGTIEGPLTDRWTQALVKALAAQKTLSECRRTPRDGWERDGKKGLDLLFESVHHLDKVGNKEEWDHQIIQAVIEQACKDLRSGRA